MLFLLEYPDFKFQHFIEEVITSLWKSTRSIYLIIHLYSYCDKGIMDRVFWTPCILYNVLLISNLVCTNAVPSSNCTTLFVLMCVKTQYRNWNEIIIDKKILCSLNNLFLLPSSISAQWHQNVRVSLIWWVSIRYTTQYTPRALCIYIWCIENPIQPYHTFTIKCYKFMISMMYWNHCAISNTNSIIHPNIEMP